MEGILIFILFLEGGLALILLLSINFYLSDIKKMLNKDIM